MKKVFLFVLMFLCMAGSMEAAGYRGNNRGRSYSHSRSSFSRSHRGGGRATGGGSYTHRIGGLVGNMFGVSYKGFIFGVEGLALQADLAAKLQLSPTKDDIKLKNVLTEEVAVEEIQVADTYQELHDTYNWSNFTFELNPNIVYQKEIDTAGRSTFAIFGGGGVSLGLIKSLNLASFGFGESNPLLGKFGVNGIVGVEFIWSRFVLSLDARPGYGLAFSSKYEYRGGLVGEDVFEVDADRNLRHFFDFGASIGFHYCF